MLDHHTGSQPGKISDVLPSACTWTHPSPPVYMPPEDIQMTREGAERFSTGSSSRVRWKAPSVLVAKLSSSPSADVDLPLLDCGHPAHLVTVLCAQCTQQRSYMPITVLPGADL